MKFISGESGRILDFTLMNRRLIWHVYQLFLKTVFPYLHKYIYSNIVYLAIHLKIYFILTHILIHRVKVK